MYKIPEHFTTGHYLIKLPPDPRWFSPDNRAFLVENDGFWLVAWYSTTYSKKYCLETIGSDEAYGERDILAMKPIGILFTFRS